MIASIDSMESAPSILRKRVMPSSRSSLFHMGKPFLERVVYGNADCFAQGRAETDTDKLAAAKVQFDAPLIGGMRKNQIAA